LSFIIAMARNCCSRLSFIQEITNIGDTFVMPSTFYFKPMAHTKT